MITCQRFARAAGLASLLFVPFLTRADAVDAYLQGEMRRGQLPGVAIAVIRNGTVIKTAGYGLANVEHNIPVTSQTVFQIQSVTKQFVATAIMMLVEEGKVSLDAPVSAYLDGTPDSWKEITVRRLLNQTSGIKDFINDPTASLRLEVTEEDVFKATISRPLNFEPGSKYAYSNTNYHLLAMIIRQITGDVYGAFLKRRIFEPLGMDQTRLMSWHELVPHRASGYQLRDNQLVNGEFVAESILAYGGGGIISTAEDMAKWDLGLRAAKIIKPASLEQMWTVTKLKDGTTSAYGFGWSIDGQSPHRFIQHSGGHITGFSSSIVRYLDDDLSVVVLVNAGFANPARMSFAIAGMYIPELRPPERKPIEDVEPSVTELLRQVEQMMRDGRIHRDLFTAQMYEALLATEDQTSTELKASGALKSVELLERRSLNDGLRQYLYRVRLEQYASLVTLVLNREGKIAGLSQQPE
jgi:D-alanyl-D-alanine carboxypeptidase